MLDSKIQKKFDAARQILVGKIPSPSAQIEQITFAMIVKFIEDMKVHNLPHKWSDFISLENDTSTLVENYQDTLSYLSENKDLPIFFSIIFKNAKLNFDSGEILRKFLSKIDEFDYFKDSEILGEGYEYLLQQYGKQGALGQFRTPKQILDFIVDVVEPSKEDKIHDPACGTGGFLVSALNYVYLKNKGIECKIFYSPLAPDAPIFKNCFCTNISNSRKVIKKSLSIPLHEDLKNYEVNYIVDSIKKFYK